MTEKRRPGRPATGRRPKLACVVDDIDRQRVEHMARQRGCSVASVLREALLVYLREEEGA